MRRQIAMALGGCLAASAALAQQLVPTTPVAAPVLVQPVTYQSPFAIGAPKPAEPAMPTMLPAATAVAAPMTNGQFVPVQPVQTYVIPAPQMQVVPQPTMTAPPIMVAPSAPVMMSAPQPMAVAQPTGPALHPAPAPIAQAPGAIQYIAVQPLASLVKQPAKPATATTPMTTNVTPVQATTAAAPTAPVVEAPVNPGCQPGSPCPNICQPCQPCCSPCGPCGRMWVSAEYLLWWTQGMGTPALVTASPAGTPRTSSGVLGAPGTVVLFGDEKLNNGTRSGFRLRAGAWLDNCQTCGIEGSYFFLCDANDGFATNSQYVGRPFTNATTGNQDSELVSYPNILTGRVDVETSSGFTGFDVNFRKNLCCDCCYRNDWLVGFRYLQLNDDMAIHEDLTVTGNDPATTIPIGTRFQITDHFRTRNEFYGPQIGLAGERRFGAAYVSWRGLLAFGTSHKEVTIEGSTTITPPGGAPTTYQGGLLALPTNIGRYVKNDFAIVPEIGINAGYQASDNVRVFVGYSFIYWSNVTRVGDVIDPVINTTQLPPGTLNGVARPAFSWKDSDFWAQGISIGAELRY